MREGVRRLWTIERGMIMREGVRRLWRKVNYLDYYQHIRDNMKMWNRARARYSKLKDIII